MRRLVVSMNVTLDGFLSGPNRELDWHFESWTSDMAAALAADLANADVLLLGRTTYTAMAGHWAAMARRTDCPREDIAFVEMLNRIDKVVVASKRLNTEWGRTTLLHEQLQKEILKLKKAGDKNILVYGSARLVAGLRASGLVDEYHLWLHPVAIGDGKSMFGDVQKMQLIRHEVFSSGVVRLNYQCASRFDIVAGAEADPS